MHLWRHVIRVHGVAENFSNAMLFQNAYGIKAARERAEADGTVVAGSGTSTCCFLQKRWIFLAGTRMKACIPGLEMCCCGTFIFAQEGRLCEGVFTMALPCQTARLWPANIVVAGLLVKRTKDADASYRHLIEDHRSGMPGALKPSTKLIFVTSLLRQESRLF